MAKEASNYDITYLGINKDGFLYEKSNEPRDGFEEINLEGGKVTYHKKYKETDDGFLDYISIDEKEFKSGTVKILSLSVRNEEGSIDKISFPLDKQSGALGDYAKGLACVLPNLDFSRKLNISPSKKKNENGYVNRFLFFNYVDGEESESPKLAHKFGEEGDIPSAEKREVRGKVTWNFEEQDNYLFDILTEEIARFNEFKKSNSNSESATTKAAKSKATSKNESVMEAETEEAEPDDLPF